VRQSRLLFYNRCVDSFANIDAWGTEMVPWTKEDVRMLKGLAPEKTKMTVIARKLKRSVGATHSESNEIGCDARRRSKKSAVKRTW
jgi:hypothetical protein